MRTVIRALVIVFALVLVTVGTVAASTYEERKDRGAALTDHINLHRPSTIENLAPKYFLYKVADLRAEQRANESDSTGTSEFPHNLNPVIDELDELGICWNWVGEVVGYSNQLDTSTIEDTATSIVHRWLDSDSHYDVIMASRGDYGGGSWHISDRGTYFFAYYVVDVCGT